MLFRLRSARNNSSQLIIYVILLSPVLGLDFCDKPRDFSLVLYSIVRYQQAMLQLMHMSVSSLHYWLEICHIVRQQRLITP